MLRLSRIAGKLAPDQLTRVRENLAAQARIRGTGDVTRAMELDAAFHIQFVESLGNGDILSTAARRYTLRATHRSEVSAPPCCGCLLWEAVRLVRCQ